MSTGPTPQIEDSVYSCIMKLCDESGNVWVRIDEDIPFLCKDILPVWHYSSEISNTDMDIANLPNIEGNKRLKGIASSSSN